MFRPSQDWVTSLFLGRCIAAPTSLVWPGGSGSGKTTLVRALRDSLPEGSVCLVSQDDYYLPKEEQLVDPNGRINFDLPTSVDLDSLALDLKSLVAGDPIYRKEYTFNQEGREARLIEVHPAPLILVEGLFLLHHAMVRSLFHLRVFVEASEERAARTSSETGCSGTRLWSGGRHVPMGAPRYAGVPELPPSLSRSVRYACDERSARG